jgi:hypothetical protein
MSFTLSKAQLYLLLRTAVALQKRTATCHHYVLRLLYASIISLPRRHVTMRALPPVEWLHRIIMEILIICTNRLFV